MILWSLWYWPSQLSEHYAQFLLMKNMMIKQKETTEINETDVDFSFSKFFETFNNLLQKHDPIKKTF